METWKQREVEHQSVSIFPGEFMPKLKLWRSKQECAIVLKVVETFIGWGHCLKYAEALKTGLITANRFKTFSERPLLIWHNMLAKLLAGLFLYFCLFYVHTFFLFLHQVSLLSPTYTHAHCPEPPLCLLCKLSLGGFIKLPKNTMRVLGLFSLPHFPFHNSW